MAAIKKAILTLSLCALALTAGSAGPLEPAALGGPPSAAAAPAGGTAATGASVPTGKPAGRRMRRAYLSRRRKLRLYGAWRGRHLLRVARASSTPTDPSARRLRRSIHRMQRRLARYLRTPRGRAALFRVRVRQRVPGWGKGHLRRIAWCESRDDPRAVGGGGAYRGMYQFSFSTWRVVGGSGDPVTASRWEQTWRAWLLLSRHGSGHWPVCG